MGAASQQSRVSQKKRAYLEHVLQRHLDAAEALLAEIDDIDGDPELEPSDGSVGGFSSYADQRFWADGATDGREEVCEDEGSQCEGGGHTEAEQDGEDAGFDCVQSEFMKRPNEKEAINARYPRT